MRQEQVADRADGLPRADDVARLRPRALVPLDIELTEAEILEDLCWPEPPPGQCKIACTGKEISPGAQGG